MMKANHREGVLSNNGEEKNLGINLLWYHNGWKMETGLSFLWIVHIYDTYRVAFSLDQRKEMQLVYSIYIWFLGI